MLLGVLLALAAGTIVIFIVSQATTGSTQVVNVVVAKTDLKAGAILSVSTSDPTHTLISDAFITKPVSADFAPANAFTFTTQDALNLELNNKVVVGTFYGGEILRQSDPRLVPLGTGAGGSLANLNPAQLKAGDVIMQIQLSAQSAGIVTGDVVDFVYIECNLPGAQTQGCESQTTLKSVYIYSVQGSTVWVVVTHQQVLQLQYLESTGKGQMVIRKPGDDPTNTTAVTGSDIVKAFGY
jgi:Flp pilus assembly protein CpaB